MNRRGMTYLPREVQRLFTLVSRGRLQRKCVCGSTLGRNPDCEACRSEHLQRRARSGAEWTPVPPMVYEVLRAPAQPLDPGTRAFMASRLGHDFSRVRIHTDARAAASARRLQAQAYTVGEDIVFAASRFAPNSAAGRVLLAHELTHVVQQQRGGNDADAEHRADKAATLVAREQSVPAQTVGGAPHGIQCDRSEEETRRVPISGATSPLRLDWDKLSLQLPPPWLLAPLATPLSPGKAPKGTSEEAAEGAPLPPSRLTVASSGSFSFGLRLGFPELEVREIPGAPPSRLAEIMRQAELIDQQLSGKVPTGWEAVDKSRLAGALWGIFSTQIAPDVASRITSSLTAPAGPGGLSFELDLVLMTDFSGGGLSFMVKY